jgi:hypothetical protein
VHSPWLFVLITAGSNFINCVKLNYTKYLPSLVTTVFDVTHTSLHMRPLGFNDDCVMLLKSVIPKLFCQQMHSLLKHKMLQLTLKISLYMVPTCFGPFGPSSGSIGRNLAKVTVFVEIISKNTSLKL